MKRELWAAAQSFVNGILVLNSLFCENGTEGECSNDELQEVAQFVKSKTSKLMIEDAMDILNRVEKLPDIKPTFKKGEKIGVRYEGKTYLATVIENFKATIEIDGQEVVVDQCKHCGKWTTEDDELYGDGYCDECAVMCAGCDTYHCKDKMDFSIPDFPLCEACKNK